MTATSVHTNRIEGLETLLRQQELGKPAPVETWDPPYRGDIGMEIKADGTWFHQGSPITREALVRLFARVLRRDEDGRHYLVTPAERVDVAVEDAPFLAVEMQVEGDGRGQHLVFRTNVDDVVKCGADHPLRVQQTPDGGIRPYVLVRGRLEALMTRAIAFDLVELAVATRERPAGVGAETFGVWSGGQFFVLDSEPCGTGEPG